jgi:hypothetical protein
VTGIMLMNAFSVTAGGSVMRKPEATSWEGLAAVIIFMALFISANVLLIVGMEVFDWVVGF